MNMVAKKREEVSWLRGVEDVMGTFEFNALVDREPMDNGWRVNGCHEGEHDQQSTTLASVFWML